jgi:hypothetical protein
MGQATLDFLNMTALSPNTSARETNPEEESAQRNHWLDVMAQLCVEVSGPLTLALERVQQLSSTGRIAGPELQALQDELALARRTSMSGQQLARLASGKLRQTHERLSLRKSMKEVLGLHTQDIKARKLTVRTAFAETEIVIDAVLLFNLLDNLVTWCLATTQGDVALRTDTTAWPVNARLSCQFAYKTADPTTSALNTVAWRVLEQTAWTMGLTVERTVTPDRVIVMFEFPRTVNNLLEGVSTIELDQGLSPQFNTKPLAGNQVLVVASRREMRIQIRDAIRDMGMVVDFVNSIEEARQFCRGGLPHVVVFESALNGHRMNALRNEIDASGAKVAFVEILEEGSDFDVSDFSRLSMAKVGRDVIASSLPSALVFELSKFGA